MERNDYLIRKKFYAYLLPGIMMVAALQLGDLVDSVFIGNFISVDALSASSVGTPVVFMAQIPVMIFGVGGSTVAGICLGRRERERASRAFGLSFLIVLFISAAIALLSLPLVPVLTPLLTRDAELAPMCETFMKLYLLGIPLISVSLLLAYFMDVDNHPAQGAALHISANAINLVLDFIFLKLMETGIAGAVYSTIIGYGAAGLIFGILYARSPARMLSFRLKKPADSGKAPKAKEKALIRETLRTGLPSGMQLLMNGMKLIIINCLVLSSAGTEGMAIYAVLSNSMFLVQLCLHGVIGVIQTIAGVLFGEKDYFGIRRVLQRVTKISLVVSLALAGLFLAAPQLIGAMFGFEMPGYEGSMRLCVRLFSLSFPFYALNYMVQTYYGSIQQSFLATLNTVLQGIALLVPFTIALLFSVGIAGTAVAAVLTEGLSLLIVVLWRRMLQKKGKLPGRDFAAIPDAAEGSFLEVTVRNTESDAANLAHRIVAYCREKDVPGHVANIIGIAAEELVANIAQYNEGKNEMIDVFLNRADNALVLRVRDDGRFFNPLAYLEEKSKAEKAAGGTDADDSLDIGGIELIRSMAARMDYNRVLKMNNTIVEVALS